MWSGLSRHPNAIYYSNTMVQFAAIVLVSPLNRSAPWRNLTTGCANEFHSVWIKGQQIVSFVMMKLTAPVRNHTLGIESRGDLAGMYRVGKDCTTDEKWRYAVCIVEWGLSRLHLGRECRVFG